MTDREALEIISMIEGGWRINLGPEGRELWASLLAPYDPEQATKAVLELGRDQSNPPRFAEVRQVILSIKRRAIDEASLPEGIVKRGVAAPEWVWVWSWARNTREPRELRGFPQQESWNDPSQILNQDEYNTLRDEWITAGRPKAKNPIPGAQK